MSATPTSDTPDDLPTPTPPGVPAEKAEVQWKRFFDTESEKGRFHIELFVSLATLMITPLLTVLIVVNREHSFVDSQRRQAREQTLLDEKIKLQSKIATLVSSTSMARLELARTEPFMAYSLLKSQDKDLPEAKRGSPDFFQERYLQTQGKLQADYAELSGNLTTSQLYFAPETVAAIDEFGSYLHENQRIRGVSPDVLKAMDEVAAKKKTPEDFFYEWRKKSNEAADADEYNRMGTKAVTAMAKEVAENLKANK